MSISLRTVCLVALVACVLIANIDAGCVCGAQGDDFCSCSQRIVRPQPILRIDAKPRKVCTMIGGAQQFQPIGDSCSCNSLIVQPALPPKSSCSSCSSSSSSSPAQVNPWFSGFKRPFALPLPLPAIVKPPFAGGLLPFGGPRPYQCGQCNVKIAADSVDVDSNVVWHT